MASPVEAVSGATQDFVALQRAPSLPNSTNYSPLGTNTFPVKMFLFQSQKKYCFCAV